MFENSRRKLKQRQREKSPYSLVSALTSYRKECYQSNPVTPNWEVRYRWVESAWKLWEELSLPTILKQNEKAGFAKTQNILKRPRILSKAKTQPPEFKKSFSSSGFLHSDFMGNFILNISWELERWGIIIKEWVQFVSSTLALKHPNACCNV